MTKVYVNVYDLNPELNKYAYGMGLGMYHSGIQINSTQYTFGGHDGDFTGVMEVEPKVNTPNFRESILVGQTRLTSKEITKIIDVLRDEFSGKSYNVVTRNCNVFADTLCRRLLGKGIPGWINRLAFMGSMAYSCVDFLAIRKVGATREAVQQKQRFIEFKGEGTRLG